MLLGILWYSHDTLRDAVFMPIRLMLEAQVVSPLLEHHMSFILVSGLPWPSHAIYMDRLGIKNTIDSTLDR